MPLSGKPANLRNTYAPLSTRTWTPTEGPGPQSELRKAITSPVWPYERQGCQAECHVFHPGSSKGTVASRDRCAEVCRTLYPLWGSGATFPQILSGVRK